MRRSRLAVALLTAGLVTSLAACGGKDDASDLPTAVSESSSTPTPTVTPSVSATPSGTPTSKVAKYGDLTLELQRPAKVDRKAELAVERFWTVHEAFAAMLSGAKTPASLSSIATGDAISVLDYLVSPQRKAKERSGGALTIQVTEAMGSTNTAVVDGCFDQRKLVTIRPDGSRYVDPTVKQGPIKKIRMTVTSTGGKWLVSAYTLRGATCQG